MRENFKVNPQYAHLSSSLREIINNFDKGVSVAVGTRNQIRYFTVKGVAVNVKRFKNPGPVNAWVYRFFRKSKAKRSYEYALKLQQFGISTPVPIAYLEIFNGGLKQSYYLSEHVEYDFDFRELIHNPKFEKRNSVLRQFTQFTFRLHESGVNFLDHSPGNTLIVESTPGNFDFYLIDLNRMRFESMDFEKRMKNFRRLWLSKKMIVIMAEEYAKLYGKSVEETKELMTKYSRAFQKKTNSKKLRKRK